MNIKTLTIREQINGYIDQLSPEKLIVVADFLGYLISKEANDATEELLKISGFESAFEKANQQIKEGKVKDWRMIRDDV